ncbi:GGDEF domain-containing protein [Vibrio sp. L3-7]|uniref:GGDEF domain-containing protein n=1 Tax=Vibrio sp. L3-7 TaxID=2912253 RepID=UPI001F261207|nr:GGDEF domain-containing protein [Vibrio sp. L3-7]MCF7505198.1 GGDEF domain-containing protein [Vibrio sp. L3-7]
MNVLKLIIKQRHWVIACATLCILCLHIGDIRKLTGFVEKDQRHRTQLIQFLVQNNVSRTLEILGATLSSSNSYIDINHLKGALHTSSSPFYESDYQTVAHRFGLSPDSSLFTDAINHKHTLWALDYDRIEPRVHLIAGNIQAPNYVETRFDLVPYFPRLNFGSNTILMIENEQQEFFMPSGEPANVTFANGQNNSNSSNSSNRVHPLETESTLHFTEAFLWNLPFFKLNLDESRYFHLITVPLPQLNAKLLVFDNMTTSVVEIIGALKNLIEIILLLGVVYLLMQAFSHYQDRTAKALESDTLTGLKNRLHLETASSRIAQEQQQEQPRCVGVIAIDLDHFKMINDKYGHHIGDCVLVRVSEILLESVRRDDECYRIGGDEFIVIIKTEKQSDIVKLADRIRTKISSDQQLHNKVSGGISASLGLVDLSTGQSIEEALISADELLYQAKHRGRNLVQSSI